MILLMRHGEDDDSRLGGWSDAGLCQNGIEQVNKSCEILKDKEYDIRHIFSSDLQRAKETAHIASEYLGIPVILLKEFREINNGDLAGISKDRFQKEYPELYFSSLDWEQQYPNGESPMQFYNRIKEAWNDFRIKTKALDGNVLLVTHSGVINIIKCIETGVQFTNKEVQFKVEHAETISIEN